MHRHTPRSLTLAQTHISKKGGCAGEVIFWARTRGASAGQCSHVQQQRRRAQVGRVDAECLRPRCSEELESGWGERARVNKSTPDRVQRAVPAHFLVRPQASHTPMYLHTRVTKRHRHLL
jgi:hypothetical protein